MIRARAILLLVAAVLLSAGAAGPSRKQRLAELPDEDRVWLTEFVAPIILPEEEKVFLELGQPHLRERFQREFWARREREGLRYPMGPGYEGRYAELRRLADEVYDGWREDAGRLVLRYGEPPSIHKVDCPHVFRDLEVWTYVDTAIRSGRVRFFLYRTQPLVPRRLWNPGVSNRDIFLPDSCKQSFGSLVTDCPGNASFTDRCDRQCIEDCDVYMLWLEIVARQHNAFGAEQEKARLLAPELVPLEGLDRLKDMSATAVDPNAKPLTVTGPSATVPVTAAAVPAAKRSKKELLANLPDEDRVWLTEYVAPIILPEEEKLFLELTRPERRERFKREFWARRDRDGLPAPLGPGYEARYKELRRLADEVYDGWKNDAGQMVIRWGEPAAIRETPDCQYVFRELQIWTYAGGPSAEWRGEFLFYRPLPAAPRRLWDRGTRESEVFLPGSCRQTFGDLYKDCPEAPMMVKLADKCKGPVCGDACYIFHLHERLASALGAFKERATIFAPATVPLEGMERVNDLSADAADPNAKPLTVTGPSATVPEPAAPARAVKRSKKERLAALLDDELEWLTSFVAPILLKEEEDLFLELTEGYQREVFKKEFWERREREGLGPPFGQGFKLRYEELRPRLDSVYDGWRNDAAQLVLHYGEPADIHAVTGCDMVFRDVEIWTYTNLGMARGNVHHLFYRPSPVAPRKLWRETRTPMEKQGATDPYAYDEIFSPGSCRKRLESLVADCVPRLGDPCKGPVCFEACDVYRVYQEELSRQGSALGGVVERARLFKLPEISTEGLEQLRKRFVTAPDPNARPLHVEGPSQRPPREPTPTPEPLRGLTADEMRERILQLPPKHRQWLELAAPLLTLDELSLFLQLSPSEKDKFIRTFWKRRS